MNSVPYSSKVSSKGSQRTEDHPVVPRRRTRNVVEASVTDGRPLITQLIPRLGNWIGLPTAHHLEVQRYHGASPPLKFRRHEQQGKGLGATLRPRNCASRLR